MSRSRSNTSTTMKIIFSAITLKPEVVETSGWLQIIPWRNTYRNGGLRSNILFTVLRHVTSQEWNFSLKNIGQGQGQRSRSVKISIITKIPYYPLLLCEISDFRKVYWSPRFVCLYFCLRVFPFVRLKRVYRPHRWSDRPDSFGRRYIQFMGPCSIFTFLYRVKFKVKVTTFVKIKKKHNGS